MATFGELLTQLAAAAGVPADSPQILDLLSKAELAQKQIDPDKSMLTLDAARNNEQLKGHFYKTFAHGWEQQLPEFAKELGLDDTSQAEIFAENSTFKKYEKLKQKAADAFKTLRAATTAIGKKEAEEEIRRLNADLAAAKTAVDAARAEEAAKWVSKMQNSEQEKILSSYDFAIDGVPKEYVVKIANEALNRKAAERKYTISFNPDNSTFGLKTEAGLEPYEGNTPVTYKGFVDSVLAEAKLLKVSGSGGTPPPITPPAGTPPPRVATAGGRNTSAYEQALANSLADYTGSNK